LSPSGALLARTARVHNGGKAAQAFWKFLSLTARDWAVNSQLYGPPNEGCVVNPSELVRIRYINGSKSFHPMHLHGHTFQIMLRQSAGPQEPVFVAPLRTVDIDIETGKPRTVDHPLPQHVSLT
jgi:FtsP/CotA-like multicopper oxidase with cupredoxin domain